MGRFGFARGRDFGKKTETNPIYRYPNPKTSFPGGPARHLTLWLLKWVEN
jgi:hypothetical protein